MARASNMQLMGLVDLQAVPLVYAVVLSKTKVEATLVWGSWLWGVDPDAEDLVNKQYQH